MAGPHRRPPPRHICRGIRRRTGPPRLLLRSCHPNTVDICAIYLSSAGTNWICCARAANASRHVARPREEFETRHHRVAARFHRREHYRVDTMVPWLCVPHRYKNKGAGRARRDRWRATRFVSNDGFRTEMARSGEGLNETKREKRKILPRNSIS